MCLTLGFAMESFAVLATDTLTFTEAGEGVLLSSREHPGGKLRPGQNGSYMTVSGGRWCAYALESEPFPNFADPEATLRWIQEVDALAGEEGRELDSYLTTVFHANRAFHVRAWSEHAAVCVDSMIQRSPGAASMATNFPRGIEDEALQAELKAAFVKDIEAALRNPDPARLIGAVLNLFRRTREHTDFCGPVVDGVLMAYSDVPGKYGAKRFKADLTEMEAVA